jgi:prepilin-type N-terminal cleavage/methylation domain-containing protein
MQGQVSRRGDDGDSLIEVLVALAVLGIGVTALTGGLSADVSTSIINRDQSQMDTLLNASAEWVKALPYQSCTGNTTSITTAQVPHPAAYTVSYGPVAAFGNGAGCSDLERVTVTVTVVSTGSTSSFDVVKRP